MRKCIFVFLCIVLFTGLNHLVAQEKISYFFTNSKSQLVSRSFYFISNNQVLMREYAEGFKSSILPYGEWGAINDSILFVDAGGERTHYFLDYLLNYEYLVPLDYTSEWKEDKDSIPIRLKKSDDYELFYPNKKVLKRLERDFTWEYFMNKGVLMRNDVSHIKKSALKLLKRKIKKID